MEFTNKINKEELKTAIIKWVLFADGYGGVIDGVLEQIPWSADMGIDGLSGLDYWDENVRDRMDNAIGDFYDNGKEWDIVRLLKEFDNVQDLNYHSRFLNFINNKVEIIYNIYQKCIDELNAHNKKAYWWKMESDCDVEESEKTFSTHEECYEDMRKAANDKVLWNIEFTDFRDDVETIPIEITANRNKIVCKSYSGTYTWSVMI